MQRNEQQYSRGPGNFSRFSASLKNASAIARFGRLQPRTATIYYIAHESSMYRLRCYETRQKNSPRTPIILVPPLMLSADVYDVSSESSAVSYLSEQGYSVWVVDFGAPERQEGGLERNFSDHILALNDAIDFVSAQTGLSVHLGGYCQGGIFCYLAAAYRNSSNVASIITFGAPVNIYKNFLPGVSDEAMAQAFEAIAKVIPKNLTPTVPAWATKNLFKLMSPSKEIKRWASFLSLLHDRDALLQTEEGRSFLGGEGFVAWPGPALQELVKHMFLGNRLVSGGCIIDDRPISLSTITCPILAVIGSHDQIAHAPSVRGIADAVPNADLYELLVNGGHMSIVMGSNAMINTWGPVAHWLQWQEGEIDTCPAPISPLGQTESSAQPDDSRLDALPTAMAKALIDIGKDSMQTFGDILGITKDSIQALSSNYGSYLSQLARLQKLNKESNIGLALTLEEQADKAGNNTFFLYAGRAYSYADASTRVDNIVKGLVSIGVRTGDHIGVLMQARPSSLATIMAANRLGAVAVLLRSTDDDSQLAIEIKMAKVQHLIADPKNASAAKTCFNGQVYVLGGFTHSTRQLPKGVIDMEEIDPARVALPDWYQPSPGKASDIAFVQFSGRDNDTQCEGISNQRWALSALGTASSTALMKSDTVYCWTPLNDPAGLLLSVSASLIAGARVALATKFDAPTFWQEARSYGARVVFYSGCLVSALVDAAPNKIEPGHAIRLFAGVGMPEPLAKRIVERFKTSKVMEIFIAQGGSAYLANISCRKIGPVVQAIPGSSDTTLVYWNHDKNQPYLDSSGYLCPVPTGATGMLLSKIETGTAHHCNPAIYNVFKKGDCWMVSGDLFMIDEDSEYRFIDKSNNLIHSKNDWLPTLAIENTVWQLDSVSIAAAYGLNIGDDGYQIPAVALCLRHQCKLDIKELSAIITQQLDIGSRPRVVRIMDSLPMTLGQQVNKQILTSQGLPSAALQRGRSFWYNPETSGYETLNKTALVKLKKELLGEKASSPPVAKKTPRKTTRKPTTKKAGASGQQKPSAKKPSVASKKSKIDNLKDLASTAPMTPLSNIDSTDNKTPAASNIVAINDVNNIILENTEVKETSTTSTVTGYPLASNNPEPGLVKQP